MSETTERLQHTLDLLSVALEAEAEGVCVCSRV
jgi:hypothetical protein